MKSERVVLVTGATGKQGGAVARHLLRQGGFAVRALTRHPEGEAARALASQGAEVVRGDFDDPSSLAPALRGCWGVFAVQNTWEAGVVREEEQGKRLAQLARESGVQHYVYSSVGSAHRHTGIPHFDNKWRVEQTVRSLGFASHVILRPVFFMENLTSPWFLQGDTVAAALKPDTVLQMIAVDDIGRFGARAFQRAEELNRAEVDIAGDALTVPWATEVLGRALGRPLRFVQVPIEEVRKSSADFALMLEWFDRVGYDVDIPALEKRFGLPLTRFEAWAEGLRGTRVPPPAATAGQTAHARQ